MAKLKEIVEFLDNFLEADEIKDSSWNGLQVEGKENVNKVMLAVDAGLETFSKAVQIGADLIIVHHGHFRNTSNPSYTGCTKERIEFLNKHGISLYASHLPLDRHREVGNNAQLLKLLGAEIKDEFYLHDGKNIGWIGVLNSPKTTAEISSVLKESLGADCKVLGFGSEEIMNIAVCSGGGGYQGWNDFLKSKADLYITGDSIEVYHQAKDTKLSVIFAGHHATETLGVKALVKVIQDKFNINAEFVDLPTGL